MWIAFDQHPFYGFPRGIRYGQSEVVCRIGVALRNIEAGEWREIASRKRKTPKLKEFQGFGAASQI